MSVADSYQDVLQRVEAAKNRSGRREDRVRIMAVTKTQSRDAVDEALEVGLRLFGENRVQEALDKYPAPPPGCELHLIGHLQRNKTRQLPGRFSAVQSIDSVRTARALNSALNSATDEAQGRTDSHGPLDIFLEINTSGEASKFGYEDRDTLFREAEDIAALSHVRIVGVMTLAPFTDDESVLRESFSSLRKTFEGLRAAFPELPITELSMGMSNDFELAVEEGSTLIRLGTVLFGARG